MKSRNWSKSSLWQEPKPPAKTFYCPLCRSERKLKSSLHPATPWHLFQIGLTAIMVMIATWGWWGWKGVLSFIPLWTIFEVVYRLKNRAALVCQTCGFDPFLYMIDTQRASQTVRQHIEARRKTVTTAAQTETQATATSASLEGTESLPSEESQRPSS